MQRLQQSKWGSHCAGARSLTYWDLICLPTALASQLMPGISNPVPVSGGPGRDRLAPWTLLAGGPTFMRSLHVAWALLCTAGVGTPPTGRTVDHWGAAAAAAHCCRRFNCLAAAYQKHQQQKHGERFDRPGPQ